MDGTSARVYGGSDMLALLDNSNSSLWVPSSSPSFHETMVNFNQVAPSNKRPCPKSDGGDEGGGGEDQYDMMSPYHQQEKKRRLTAEQVQFLEKSFEMENKLEPERKVQLAKELGLQPRQVAIWFQNRRARYKTKQLEKDYDSLKSNFDQLQADYDSLLKERQDLQDEVKLLTKKLKQRDMGWSNSVPDSPENPLNSDPINDGISKTEADDEKVTKTDALVAVPSANTNSNKQIEDASSAKSDVFDSEDPADSTQNMVDPDLQSDYSQDEDEQRLMMSKNLILPTPVLPPYNNNLLKVDQEVGCYDPTIGSAPCNFSLVEDQPFWSWLY